MSDDKILVVDLDNTLIKSDLLFETFWAAISQNWRIILHLFASIFFGKAHLKRKLANSSEIDVPNLPYNTSVLDIIEEYKADGAKIALVSASDQKLVDQIAKHLGFFDEAFGSNGDINLKGKAKANFLINRYGKKKFIYVADDLSDLSIWQYSAKIITINASKLLLHRVNNLEIPIKHVCTEEQKLTAFIKFMRPHQWTKNLLVFLPMTAAHLFAVDILLSVFSTFLSFCLVASSGYILNDLIDLQHDRRHPRKKNRQIASGSVPIKEASVVSPILLICGMLLSLTVNWHVFAILSLYFLTTLLYSLVLKRKVIIDIFTLAGLYTHRVLAGAATLTIAPSIWLIAFSLFFFLSLAALKRQAELIIPQNSFSKKLDGRDYNRDDLPIVVGLGLSSGFLSVLVLLLYTQSALVKNLYGFPEALLLAAIAIAYWISRLFLISQRGGMHDDPIVFAIKDITSYVCLILVFASTILGVLI